MGVNLDTAITPCTSAFSRRSGSELYEQGRIDYHPVFPGEPGYAARRIETEDDIRDVIELLRLNYDRGGGAARPATAA